MYINFHSVAGLNVFFWRLRYMNVHVLQNFTNGFFWTYLFEECRLNWKCDLNTSAINQHCKQMDHRVCTTAAADLCCVL